MVLTAELRQAGAATAALRAGADLASAPVHAPVHAVTRYGARAVPRYTSYPTAPHFKADFPPADYRDWLSALPADRAISLYVHIPFCRQVCWYCGCNMKLARRPEPVTDYVETLLQEIALTADLLPTRPTVSHLHFGGGTPTVLSPSDLARLMAGLRDRFEITANAELAIEADPRGLTADLAATIGAEGFTRASFGIQELDPQVQLAINRVQPLSTVARAVDAFRQAGVPAINFDLIYGLPHQTTASLLETIAQCLTLSPDRFALFGYAHVPWMAKKQRLIDEAALPDGTERAAQAEAAATALMQAGYRRIGLDHFAKPIDSLSLAATTGRLRRNFQGYTTDQAETMLPFGATAIGRTPFGYVQNLAETGAWARAVGEGALPIAKGYAFVGDDVLRAHVIERIMCDGAIDTAAAARAHGFPADWFSAELFGLRDMAQDGLVDVAEGRLSITPEGAPLVRIVASAFDAFLKNGAARHSAAV